MFLHSIISGLFYGLAIWYLLPSNFQTLYNNQVAVTVVLVTFSWLTVIIGQFSLTVGGGRPVETSAYKMVDTYELQSLSRVLHASIFFIFHILQM